MFCGETLVGLVNQKVERESSTLKVEKIRSDKKKGMARGW
jgi:hypothetical protein